MAAVLHSGRGRKLRVAGSWPAPSPARFASISPPPSASTRLSSWRPRPSGERPVPTKRKWNPSRVLTSSELRSSRAWKPVPKRFSPPLLAVRRASRPRALISPPRGLAGGGVLALGAAAALRWSPEPRVLGDRGALGLVACAHDSNSRATSCACFRTPRQVRDTFQTTNEHATTRAPPLVLAHAWCWSAARHAKPVREHASQEAGAGADHLFKCVIRIQHARWTHLYINPAGMGNPPLPGRLVLVGDPKQPPPFVRSAKAKEPPTFDERGGGPQMGA